MSEPPEEDRPAARHSPRTTSDPAALKALAHPLRLKILRRLAAAGAATATALAAELGENTGTLSYHLRQLERAGFIEDDPEHSANGRERWWRGVRGLDVRRPAPAGLSPAERAVVGELDRLRMEEDIELAYSYTLPHPGEEEWVYGSRGTLHLTRGELQEFHDAYLELLRRFQRRRTEGEPGTRPVAVRWFGVPLDGPGPQPPGPCAS
ncbi:winged helix-turn-helix domain-containing protein [Streptomyces spirodelae]|uniref:Helix-turn-helix transcriptional regulator n=1 Tax=Streptomyces spirodelae TaxID=2812904 RepID=A0ABS3X3P0_9ACTN|nr:helix-turn-helix domain-containing protein [Streptomyces spirodelae]MBO8189931.1 helix-turn-helix transcriptional regulator [Streptomyces spirodelae]